MNAVEVSTVVAAPSEEIYDFLVDFTGYGRYSSFVDAVDQRGDGGVGTEYAITVSWWELSYTATSRVTATDPPDRIDWRLLGGVDAHGHWRIESADVDPGGVSTAEDGTTAVDGTAAIDGTTPGGTTATDDGEADDGTDPDDGDDPNDDDDSDDDHCLDDEANVRRVVLRIEYDPGTVGGSEVPLPTLLPFDAVVDRIAPKIRSEAESIVAAIVADLEGERRDVELSVHEVPEGA